MANQTILSDEVLEYIRAVSLRDDAVLSQLRERTELLPMGRAMQIMAEEGQFLRLLAAISSATTIIDVGTFTGYSALCLAWALPANVGKVITCDITERWSSIAKEHWELAGVSDKIEALIGDAADILKRILADRGPNSVDMIFIDADKRNYPSYYDWSIQLVRPGGIVVLDNTLFFGRVIDPLIDDVDTEAIRTLNRQLATDMRVDISLLPLADGITVVRKRPPLAPQFTDG